MKRLADGLFQLRGFPPHVVNIYLMDGILIDAGTRFDVRRILRQLKGQTVTAHALTHAHPDHQGSSHAVCEALGLPLWCGSGDAEAVEDPTLIVSRLPQHWLNRTVGAFASGPAHPVARRLREGDEVGGFRVIETPGHSAGHVSYWRESDRTLILGDVLANMRFATGLPGLRTPPKLFTPDPARNRESARLVARLEPTLICFGHGPPLRDTGKFVRFIENLKEG
jgi:glyoxylase-like metal-dependent hydrolase (beta-lactamase superfamily II)